MAAPTIGRRPRWNPGPTASVDWSHPISLGLKSYVLPSHSVDLVRGLVTTSGNPARAATPYGQGLTLDGVDDYVDIGRPIGAGAWTLFALVKLASTVNGFGPAIIGERYTSSNSNVAYNLGLAPATSSSPSNLATGYFNGGWSNAVGSALTVGAWTSCAGTFAGSAGLLSLYVDGLRVATNTGSGTDPAPNENTNIGRRHDATGTSLFPGDIAVAAIWNRALPAVEVAALYADPFVLLRT